MANDPNSIKAGDTDPLVAVLEDANGPVNIAGAAVTFRMKSRVAGAGHAPIAGACDIVQSVDANGRITDRGKVSYPWAVGETDIPGVYGIEFEVVFANGKSRTFPNDRTVTLEIEPTAT